MTLLEDLKEEEAEQEAGNVSDGASAADLLRRAIAECERLQELLLGRAGKLLKKRKPFIVVANDEPYFTTVYLVIRESEKAKGRWTEDCERCFQELTNHDWPDDIELSEDYIDSHMPPSTPELQALLREQVEKNKLTTEVKRLQVDRDAWRAATGLASLTPAEAGAKIDADDEERGWLREEVERLQVRESLLNDEATRQVRVLNEREGVILKQRAEVKRLQAEIKRLRSREGLIELCQAQRRKDDVAVRVWAKRQREAAEAAKEE